MSPRPNARPRVVALDLEGTLISNAVSQIPRPGLRLFIDLCLARFERVVVFTAVVEARVRPILRLLEEEGHLPRGFGDTCEVVDWRRPLKDLRFVPGVDWREVLLVDDRAEYVAPGQEGQWVPVGGFDGVDDQDDGLQRVAAELLRRLV